MRYTRHYAHQIDDMITFDGKVLSETIPDVKIINVIIGAVEIETVTNKRVMKSGSDYRRRRNGIRKVRIIVEFPLDRIAYAENVRLLREWAESSEPKPLLLPAYPEDQIYVTLTGFDDFTQREWWLPIEIEFTAWDPYFESISENSGPVESVFTIDGNGDPSVHLTYNLDMVPLIDPEWTFEDGKKIKLMGTFNSGELDIDFDRLMVYQNGASVMRKLTLASRFPEFTPGIHQITGPSGGVIKWKERWA